ncbi:MAG: acetolactate synthase small subunit [Propionibacteriaceae bacterium]|jgi:acetolactate synthase-1/3 small subunit|nr:acetolactate synthase small subunit [Propionibacteriaceae bacterium]
MKSHTLSVLVSNRPGVLARVASLFSRRGFNIESLTVGPTLDPDISRMTVVVQVESALALEQIVKQLAKLIEVFKIIELDSSSVDREMMLIKVHAPEQHRSAIIDVVRLFRAHAVDVGSDSMTVEVTGSVDKLRALVELLLPYGIIETATSGHVALIRGARSITDKKRPALVKRS